MTARIQDPNNVFVADPDTGKEHNAGQIMDVIRNWPNEASNVQLALADWWAEQQAKHTDAIDAARKEGMAAKQSELENHVAKLQGDHDKEKLKITKLKERAEGKIAELQAVIDEKDSLIQALGGTEEAKRLRKENRRKELAEAQARIVKELAAL